MQVNRHMGVRNTWSAIVFMGAKGDELRSNRDEMGPFRKSVKYREGYLWAKATALSSLLQMFSYLTTWPQQDQ